MIQFRFKESKTLQRITFWVFGSFLLVHFTFTLVHTLPDKVPTYLLRGVARAYMKPFFHQGWALFAPDVPQQQFDLDYRYKEKASAEWSEWKPANDLRPRTAHPRVAQMVEKMLMLVARDLGNDLTYNDDDEPQYELITSSKPYFFTVYYTVRRHEVLYVERPGFIQLKLSARHTPRPSWSRIAEPPADRSFVFPPYAVPEK